MSDIEIYQAVIAELEKRNKLLIELVKVIEKIESEPLFRISGINSEQDRLYISKKQQLYYQIKHK